MTLMSLITLLYALHAEDIFVPFRTHAVAPGGNQLLTQLTWYFEGDGAANSNETPETPNPGLCCSGQVFQQCNANWGSAAGVITNSRTAGAAASFVLPYDYGGGMAFTVAGWVKLAATNSTQTIASSWDDAFGFALAEWRIRYLTASNKFEMEIVQANQTNSVKVQAAPTVAIGTGVWYFICAGWDGSTNAYITTETRGAGSLPALTTTALTTIANVSIGATFGATYNTFVCETVSELISTGSAIDGWGWWQRQLDATQRNLLFAETPYGSFTF